MRFRKYPADPTVWIDIEDPERIAAADLAMSGAVWAIWFGDDSQPIHCAPEVRKELFREALEVSGLIEISENRFLNPLHVTSAIKYDAHMSAIRIGMKNYGLSFDLFPEKGYERPSKDQWEMIRGQVEKAQMKKTGFTFELPSHEDLLKSPASARGNAKPQEEDVF